MLSDIVLRKGEYAEVMQWEDLIPACTAKMSPAYQVSVAGQDPVIKKGKLQPVVINVAQRTGNKKVC